MVTRLIRKIILEQTIESFEELCLKKARQVIAETNLKKVSPGIYVFPEFKIHSPIKELLVLIHPYHEEYEQNQNYIAQREKAVESAKSILIGTNVGWSRETIKEIINKKKLEDRTYIYFTAEKSPIPLEVWWGGLVEFIERLNPQKIILGGAELSYNYQGELSKKHGCINSTYKQLETLNPVIDPNICFIRREKQ